MLRFDPPVSGGVVGLRWMVKAPDAHAIDGSFSFTVTAPAPALAPDEPVPAAEATSAEEVTAPAVDLESFLDTETDQTKTPRRVGAAGRMISLAGTLVGLGALIFAAAVLRGARRDVRHVLHWVRRAGLLVVAGATVELVAQLAVDGGGRWSAIWSFTTLGSVLASSFGIAVALRIVGGLAMASGARIDITHASETPDPVVAIRELVGAGVGSSSDVWAVENDDTGSGRQLTGSEPYLHHGDQAWSPTLDSAGAVWAGGVLMLTSVLWRRHRQGRELRALQLAVRFSVVATIALVAVGLAGVVLTVIILDSPSELWSTDWGRLLMLKTLFVVAAGAAGGYNHKVLIPQMESAPDDPALTSQFRAIVTGEAAALVAVLIATAFLMGAAS